MKGPPGQQVRDRYLGAGQIHGADALGYMVVGDATFFEDSAVSDRANWVAEHVDPVSLK